MVRWTGRNARIGEENAAQEESTRVREVHRAECGAVGYEAVSDGERGSGEEDCKFSLFSISRAAVVSPQLLNEMLTIFSQLKKHDKRTALTATLGFPQFIAAATSISPDGINSTVSRALHLPGFPSLPHILLATFTSTLLPIIPSLDDYECSICSEVSYKPIRLDCGHKFCGTSPTAGTSRFASSLDTNSLDSKFIR